MNSAVFSHYDILNGVTENVMLGQLCRLGTGLVDLLLDHTKLEHAIDTLAVEDIHIEDDELERNSVQKMENTPYVYAGTPFAYLENNSSGGDATWEGSITPMQGAFTPAIQTPYADGSSTPAVSYQSPYYGLGSGAISPTGYHASPSYVSMSPEKSGALGPHYQR
jgi:DNA-directed RNA polymerase II subunit RPB1